MYISADFRQASHVTAKAEAIGEGDVDLILSRTIRLALDDDTKAVEFEHIVVVVTEAHAAALLEVMIRRVPALRDHAGHVLDDMAFSEQYEDERAAQDEPEPSPDGSGGVYTTGRAVRSAAVLS